MSTYVVTDACTACGACLLTCPEHALVAGLPLRVRADRCTACGECVEVCPADAILELPGPVPADHAGRARPLSVAGEQHLHDRRTRDAARGALPRPGGARGMAGVPHARAQEGSGPSRTGGGEP